MNNFIFGIAVLAFFASRCLILTDKYCLPSPDHDMFIIILLLLSPFFSSWVWINHGEILKINIWYLHYNCRSVFFIFNFPSFCKTSISVNDWSNYHGHNKIFYLLYMLNKNIIILIYRLDIIRQKKKNPNCNILIILFLLI